MDARLKEALALRNKGERLKSNALLGSLVQKEPISPILNYQYAWSFDILGKESKAIPYYEKAIKLGLAESELAEAYLGLGSTYRALGLYDKSVTTFERGLSLFPENKALHLFLAMALYNQGKHEKSMTILLQALATTSNDATIQQYKHAILFYSDKLDHIWTD